MSKRIPVTKTYKLSIGGSLPRSESGRSLVVENPQGTVIAHACQASRKDLRAAVEAAQSAFPKWRGCTAYLRGQILYRMAEMMEGKRDEFARSLSEVDGRSHDDAITEVDAAIDRVVCFAGWTDKYHQVLGCANPVAGPYHNFTIPEPVGVTATLIEADRPLLGLVSEVAPAMATGCSVIAVVSGTNPLPACILGEVIATSDVPPGVLNILTGDLGELVPPVAEHAGIDAVLAAGLAVEQVRTLRLGVAGNLKRVTIWDDCSQFEDTNRFEGVPAIEPFVEFKTMWHPAAT